MKKLLFAVVIICLLLTACKEKSISKANPSESLNIDSSALQESISEVKPSESLNIDLPALKKYSDSYDVDDLIDETILVTEMLGDKRIYYLREQDWYNTTYNYEEIEQIKTDASSNINIDGEFAEMLPAINNNISIENIILPCKMETFIEGDYTTRTKTISNSYTMPGNWCKHPISPVAVLRQTEPGFYYTIYTLDNGGWLYRFFAPYILPGENFEGDIPMYKDMTRISLYGSIYMEEVLQYSDFSSITIGDSVEKVSAIDSAVNVYMFAQTIDENAHSDTHTKYLTNYRESRHLLADGVLTIIYEFDGNGWVVSQINFSEEFVYTSHYNNQNKYFKILPQDYPPV